MENELTGLCIMLLDQLSYYTYKYFFGHEVGLPRCWLANSFFLTFFSISYLLSFWLLSLKICVQWIIPQKRAPLQATSKEKITSKDGKSKIRNRFSNKLFIMGSLLRHSEY